MEVIYKVNGREFEDKKEAEKYEKIIEEDKIKAEKLRAEKEARWKEVEEARTNYNNLLDNYIKDYGYGKLDLSNLPLGKFVHIF